MLHKVSACRDRMWDRNIANSLINCWQTVSLPVCELWAIAELTERTHSLLGLGSGRKRNGHGTKGTEGYGKTEFGQDAAISVEEEATFVQSYKSCPWPWPWQTLDWMPAQLETIACKFRRNRAVCLAVETICAKSVQTDDGRRAIVLAHGMS